MKIDQMRCWLKNSMCSSCMSMRFRELHSVRNYHIPDTLLHSHWRIQFSSINNSISNDRKCVKSINRSELEWNCNDKAQPYNRKNCALGNIHFIMIISIANYLISKIAWNVTMQQCSRRFFLEMPFNQHSIRLIMLRTRWMLTNLETPFSG